MNRHDRLKEAYDYLRYQHGIHTQMEMANALQITRSSFSAAMNGNEKYLTDSLVAKAVSLLPDNEPLPKKEKTDIEKAIEAIQSSN